MPEHLFNIEGPLTILLIEDNPLEAELFTEFLADSGGVEFHVEHVPRLRLALERLDKGGVDIVFLDFVLPDGDGFQSLAKLRKYAPNLPVIMLTGLDDDEVGLEAVAQGAQDYLVKGQVEARTIWRIVRYAIVRKRIEQQLRDRQILEARVQQAQRAESLAVLAGGIAHEYNNLLTGILGNASLALAELPPEHGVRALLEDIRRAAQRAGKLTGQMLAYSGRGQFTKRILDLGVMLEETVPELESILRNRGRLVVQQPATPLVVEGAPRELRQVMINLVSNGAEALNEQEGVVRLALGGIRLTSPVTFEQGSLTSTLPLGFYATITVSDTGCGIPPEHLPRIFDPFYTTKFTGRGLGLASVLGIVRGHDGAVKVSSEEGVGTTVQVFLPMNEPEGGGFSVARPYPRDRQWRVEGVALVVDDEDLIVSVTRKILEQRGLEVVAAASWREGVGIAKQHGENVRLVVLDGERLPLDARVVFDEFRRSSPKVAFLVCSDLSETESRRRFGVEGSLRFLRKPFLPNALLEKVGSMLGPEAAEDEAGE